MAIPPGTVVIGYVCKHDGRKFLVATMPGATPGARLATARQRAMLYTMNEYRGSQKDLVEEFVYLDHAAELKELETRLHLNRYHHNMCGQVLQNIEEAVGHICKD